MRGDRALANVNMSAWKELAEMIISATVTEAKLEHVAVQVMH